jgi:hypothetical protein
MEYDEGISEEDNTPMDPGFLSRYDPKLKVCGVAKNLVV